jgi:glyoxylase-like metal-dependent hydrolase (beta-lactamase superfamily II)
MIKEEKTKWHKIEGNSALFYPLYHKSPDLLSSNSFLVKFPGCFVVIDPGGTAAHFESLLKCLEINTEENNLPIFIFLTHCHFDHVRALHFTKEEDKKKYILIGHCSAAEILKKADLQRTISYLYTNDIPPVKLDYELFSASVDSPEIKLSGLQENQQTITLDGNHEFITYHIPGHSDCSVCYQIGNMLFTGDILFAHNPAIAGTIGFSQPDLCESLNFISSLILNERIDRVFSGHGPEITGEKAVKIINSILGNLPELKDLVHLDLDRYRFLKDCTITFIKEIEHQIISQNGRFQRIALELEKLEETELANKIIETSLQDKLDQFLQGFYQFITSYDSNMINLDIPVQGASLMKTLQNTFNAMTIPPQITLHYLERLKILFNSCLTLIRGIDFSLFSQPTNLTEIIESCIELYSQVELSQENLLELAESKEEFAIYMARRIDSLNRNADIDFQKEPFQLCMANPEHLTALLGDVIESMVSYTPRKITIKSLNNEKSAGYLFISQPVWKIIPHKAKFYQLFASLLNGEFLQYENGDFSFSFNIPTTLLN